MSHKVDGDVNNIIDKRDRRTKKDGYMWHWHYFFNAQMLMLYVTSIVIAKARMHVKSRENTCRWLLLNSTNITSF